MASLEEHQTDADLKEVAVAKAHVARIGRHTNHRRGLKDVAKLQNLGRLELRKTQITDEGLKDVAKLQKLSILGLDFTQITDEGLKELVKLQELVELYFLYQSHQSRCS